MLERHLDEPEIDYMNIFIVLKMQNKIVTPVSDHFSKNGHNYKDISFQVIERCHNLNNSSDTSQCRKRREMYWIWLLKTVTPLGLNHMV
jgi:hypothetical protein